MFQHPDLSFQRRVCCARRPGQRFIDEESLDQNGQDLAAEEEEWDVTVSPKIQTRGKGVQVA